MAEFGKWATRREVLAAGAGTALALVMPVPVACASEQMQAAIHEFAGTGRIESGGVKLDVPPLVENGNSVAVTVTVDSPMTEAAHVRRIALFNEKNPQPDVAIFHLGPRAGRAEVATRIRLATTQQVLAVAEMSDGSFRSAAADVVVTLAACVEE